MDVSEKPYNGWNFNRERDGPDLSLVAIRVIARSQGMIFIGSKLALRRSVLSKLQSTVENVNDRAKIYPEHSCRERIKNAQIY